MNKFVALFATVLSLVFASGCGAYGSSAVAPPMMNGGPMPGFVGGVPGAPMMVAPMAQNVGILGQPITMCPALLRLEIANDTQNQFLSIQIDGVDLAVYDHNGQLPSYIPPHAIVHVCLENLEQHAFTGTRYIGRINQLVPLIDQPINITQTFTVYNDHHKLIFGNSEIHTG